MSLGTPWMLLLLPLVALVGWLMARARRLQRDAACRLKGVVPEERPGPDWAAATRWLWRPSAVRFLRWPGRNGTRVPMRWNAGRAIWSSLLDVSRSMLAADVFPSRLEAARIAIHEALPALAGQRIALITFAGSAAVRVPLTLDHGFVRYMLDRADPSDMDLGSTSLQAAVEKAVGAVLTDAAGGRRDLVMFTDGEDHLSNIEKTAEMLAKCGAARPDHRPGRPAPRCPRAGSVRHKTHGCGTRTPMVVSRLDEGTLAKLAGKSSHVTYYPARTHPFDLVTLYQQMIAGATGDVVVGELREVRYTEGYPYLLGLAVGAVAGVVAIGRLPAARHLAGPGLLLLPGCGSADGRGRRGGVSDKGPSRVVSCSNMRRSNPPSTCRPLARCLLDAREAFLRAGLLRPGDIETARQITAVTRRLREVDAAIEKQRASGKETRRDSWPKSSGNSRNSPRGRHAFPSRVDNCCVAASSCPRRN